MDDKEKRALSESDICDLFITPAIKDAGWDHLKQIRREVTLTPGPVVVRGNMVTVPGLESCKRFGCKMKRAWKEGARLGRFYGI